MPALMPMPAKANTPVMGIDPPSTMSSPWARTGPVTSAAAAAAAARMERRWMLMSVSCCGLKLRPERPEMEEAPHAPPDFGQAMRFEDQEPHDQRAEHHGAHGREDQ